jgi:hypothetical protein
VDSGDVDVSLCREAYFAADGDLKVAAKNARACGSEILNVNARFVIERQAERGAAMRKWGIVIAIIYALIVLTLLVPALLLMVGGVTDFGDTVLSAYATGWYWIPAGIVICGEMALLFLTVDTSRQRLKPRAHILVSGTVAAALTAMLTAAAIWAIGFAARGDDFWSSFWEHAIYIAAFLVGLWLLWGIFFYLYLRNSSAPLTRVISWLLRGSVLELLIAVPCHIIVRRRQDCSAPIATSFGITTGIAIMLLSFGPSVLLLYKKRLDEYSRRGTTAG